MDGPHRKATSESKANAQHELANSRLLHDISNELIGEQNIDALYVKLVDAAALLMRSQFASMQALHQVPNGGSELQLLAHRGFNLEAVQYWDRVRIDSMCSCGVALTEGRRTIIADVEQHEPLADTGDLTIYRKNGIRSVQSTPLYARGGELVGMISTHWDRPHCPSEHELQLFDILARQAADLIERTKVEKMLRESEERLIESDRMKDQFLATLAHELRNPLAPIGNSLQLLRRQDRAPDAALLDMLDRQVNHMVHLVDDLLEMSRISRGFIELKQEVLDMGSVLHIALEASKPLIEQGGHSLELQLTAEPVSVRGDVVRLTQVFTNLLNNATKYTDQGGRIELAMRVEGDHALIEVRDNGIGVAKEQLPRLFQMFAQADAEPASRRQGGLGIGLSLAYRLVHMHGGSIEAQSEGLGMGSCFTVRLPLAMSCAVLPPEAQPADVADLQQLRVLVVDDNRDAGDSLGMLLDVSGADVRLAYDGAAALSAIDEYRPSVVLLDLGMPGMDGYEVARRIRADQRHDDITLVAITGWDQQKDRQHTSEAGFDHHLVKPVNLETLAALLQQIK